MSLVQVAATPPVYPSPTHCVHKHHVPTHCTRERVPWACFLFKHCDACIPCCACAHVVANLRGAPAAERGSRASAASHDEMDMHMPTSHAEDRDGEGLAVASRPPALKHNQHRSARHSRNSEGMPPVPVAAEPAIGLLGQVGQVRAAPTPTVAHRLYLAVTSLDVT